MVTGGVWLAVNCADARWPEVDEVSAASLSWYPKKKVLQEILKFLIIRTGNEPTFTSSDFFIHSNLVTPSTNTTCKAILQQGNGQGKMEKKN